MLLATRNILIPIEVKRGNSERFGLLFKKKQPFRILFVKL